MGETPNLIGYCNKLSLYKNSPVCFSFPKPSYKILRKMLNLCFKMIVNCLLSWSRNVVILNGLWVKIKEEHI